MRAPFTIVASVGTYHHPFNRFVDWLEPWTSAHHARVLFQHGSTRPMAGAENHEMLSPKLLLKQYSLADAVVLQGGAGGVMDARKAGRIPIIVPRRPVGNEVVDGHQIALSRRLAAMGLVHVAESQEELARLLDGIESGTIPTRDETHRQSPGVSTAVRMLTTRAGDNRTTGSRPRGTLHGTRHQGFVGHVLALGVAAVLIEVLSVSDAVGSVVLAGVAAWLLYSFLVLRAFERARSMVPAIRFAEIIGVGLIVAIIAGVENSDDLRRGLLAALAAALTLALAAFVNRRVFRLTPTVLVGEEQQVRDLAARWEGRKDLAVVASCVWRKGAESLPPASAGSLADVVSDVMGVVIRQRARSVVIASECSLTAPTLRQLAWSLERAHVECVVLADLHDHVEYGRPRYVGDHVAIAMRPPRDRAAAKAVKSVTDRLAAALGLVLLAPLMLAIVIAIRLTSPGPAIFRQMRWGRHGEPFTMYKFRTMVAGAEGRLAELRPHDEGAGPLFKLSDDPRVTPLGRFLRRSSLDELPQLVNVLRGDMSLVGPRPALPAETAKYDDRAACRLQMKPGITGMWQVSGRSTLSWEESIRLDVEYVKNWNLRLDAVVLARTVRAVLSREGAL